MMLLPGPVDVPEEVLRASAFLCSHRSDEFREIVRSSSDLMSKFGDAEATVITTGSGTTAIESMIYSMTRPHEGVLAVSFGEFGNRLIDSLNRRGCDTVAVEKEHNDLMEKGEISSILERNSDISTVCLVHNETGNGTSLHNLKDLAKEAKDAGMKVLVDSVSGFGASEIKANTWGIDAFATCSQKAIASMPGLGLVSLSGDGISHVRKDPDIPKYMDLSVSLKFLDKDETPVTPSTGSFNALNTALKILDKEGIENRWRRHSKAAAFVREQVVQAGSRMYGVEGNYSDSVLAFEPPVGVNKVRSDLKAEGILVSRGMKAFADRMLRVGLLGVVDANKISAFINSYFKSAGLDRSVEPEDVPKGAGFDTSILEEISEEST